MKYKWEKTIFKPKDFEGCGHYIVKETINKENSPFISNTGYLSTIMMKVGWFMDRDHLGSNKYCLIDMSDGLIKRGYYTNTKNEDGTYTNTSEWVFNEFLGDDNTKAITKLCEYLNNNPHGDTFRFATNEEIVRVVMYQRGYRTKELI